MHVLQLSCLCPGQILEMPYVGETLSMLIFLPYQMEDSSTGLEKVGASNALLAPTARLTALTASCPPSAGGDADL